MSNAHAEPRPLKLLSIDGGGIQGMAALVTIRELMRRIQGELGLSFMPLPCEYFDLIVGTGIGGLIAIMLGRLRMTVEETMDWFQEIVTYVFSSKKLWGDGLYKATILEQVLGRMVLRYAGDADARMLDKKGNNNGCKTAVCAMSADTMRGTILFRSYKSLGYESPDCSIIQAVRATMARPGLFKPVDIKDHGIKLSFVDAGLGCNNPTLRMLDEAKLEFPDQEVGCIISVGNGQTKVASIPATNRIGWISSKQEVQVMKSILTDCERTSQEVQVRLQHIPEVYYRFNIERGLEDADISNLDKIPKVMADSMHYHQLIEVDRKLKSAVQATVSGGALVTTAQLDGTITRVVSRGRIKICPPPSMLFTGQAHILLEVEECLLDGSQMRHVFVLHGLGGAGKTQIALKFVEKHRDSFWDVFYIDGSSTETISTDLKNIAIVKGAGDTKDDALSWLARQHKKWLIVFNNADNTSISLQQYFPACSHGDILVTTRNYQMINLATGTNAHCKVSDMLPEDASELLLKTLGMDTVDNCIQQHCTILVQELGFLALAIVQAGAYIRVNQLTPEEYLEIYKKNKVILEKYREIGQKSEEYPWTVYTTWRISYDQLAHGAAEFLRLLGFIHCDGILESIFQNACERLSAYKTELIATAEEHTAKETIAQFLTANFCNMDNVFDKIAFLDIISELRSYSLVDFDPCNRTYSVHSLVHYWVRRVVAEDARTTQLCAALLLSLSVHYKPEPEISLSQQTLLIPHIDAVLVNSEAIPCVANDFAWIYQEADQWKAAEKLLNIAMQASERILGKLHPISLYNIENLAATISHQGRFSEAEALRLNMATACKHGLGETHAHTLWTIENLVNQYSRLKQFKQAENFQLQIIDIKKQTVGEEHTETLTATGNLAVTYFNQDRFTDAEALQLSLRWKFERIMGGQHELTLQSIQHLVLTYASQKRWKTLEHLQWAVTGYRLDSLGSDHSSTHESMLILAWLYRNERVPYDLQMSKVPLQQDMYTLKRMQRIVLLYREQGRLLDAIRLGTRVLHASMQVLGMNHEDTSSYVRFLTSAFEAMGYDGSFEVTSLLNYWASESRTKIKKRPNDSKKAGVIDLSPPLLPRTPIELPPSNDEDKAWYELIDVSRDDPKDESLFDSNSDHGISFSQRSKRGLANKRERTRTVTVVSTSDEDDWTTRI